MPGKTTTRKYSAAQEGTFRMEVLYVLNNSEDAMTIEQIKNESTIILGGLTSQKMARILGHLIEMGVVRKAKSKQKGRMVYKTVSKMIEQGYEFENEGE